MGTTDRQVLGLAVTQAATVAGKFKLQVQVQAGNVTIVAVTARDSPHCQCTGRLVRLNRHGGEEASRLLTPVVTVVLSSLRRHSSASDSQPTHTGKRAK